MYYNTTEKFSLFLKIRINYSTNEKLEKLQDFVGELRNNL